CTSDGHDNEELAGEQAGMSRENTGGPFSGCMRPCPLENRENDQCFAASEKEGCNHITWPMRPEINPRVAHGDDDNPVYPATFPIKKRETDCGRGVVGYMSRWKGWA